QWFQVELPEETLITGLLLDQGKSKDDYPRGYTVALSADGTTWGKPIAEGKGTSGSTEIMFPPTRTKFIRITQTGTTSGTFWSIHEMQIFQPAKVKEASAAEPQSKKTE